MLKYKFIGAANSLGLRQIQARRAIPRYGVNLGDLGGWIGKESNLSHDGNAWVQGNAWVFGDARVYGNAQVYGNAWVQGNAQVYGNAQVQGNALVYGNAQVQGNALVYGDALVYGNAQVYGNALVYGDAQVQGNAQVIRSEWSVSPLCIQGTRHCLTTCSRTQISVGCEIHTVKDWLKNYRAIGKRNGYSSRQISEYKLLIDTAAAWLRRRPWKV